MMAAMGAEQAMTACRLTGQGYPVALAFRVACTPPFEIAAPSDGDDARPGREIADAVEANFGRVVRMVAARIGGAP